MVAGLKADEERERQEARKADRKAEALEAARRVAEADAHRRRRREALVRAQIATLEDRATTTDADELALERDVLARERDASKAALEKARAKGGGYAVLPHKGPNGTWQRPVVIECRAGVAILQPRGTTFTMLDMSPLLGARSSPMVAAVARELMRVEDLSAPDGSPVTPYIYFIVRPDGVRPFYEARGRLEPLGIAFGYELVDQDWEIEFPDLNTWEAGGSSTPVVADRAFQWPSEQPGARPDEPSNPYLWPRSRPGGTVAEESDEPGGLASGRGRSGRSGAGRRLPGMTGAGAPDGLEGLLGKLGDGQYPPEGVDVTPLLDAFERVGPEGLQRLIEARRGRSPGASARPGVSNLPSDRVPNLEPAEPRDRGTESEPGATPSGEGRPALENGDSFERVPIVPEMLEDKSFEDRPPSPPRNARADATRPPIEGVPGGMGVGSGTTVGSGPTAVGPNPGRPANGMPGAPRAGVVQVPLDLVVACGRDGVTIHPGGYRVTKATLATGGRLARDLQTIVGNYQRLDPGVIPRPRLEFLIELGGHETFAEARRQTVLMGEDWPVSIRVAESSAPGVFGKERF
jgi:hypothetical protein